MSFFRKYLTGKPLDTTADLLPTTTIANQDRIKHILGISKLESMPAHAAKAFELTIDPSSSIRDFSEVIGADEALSSKIIRVANSVFFSRGQEATGIEQAIATIGLDELKGLLNANLLKGLLKSKHPVRSMIWANSVGVAIVARSLSRFTNHNPGVAFLSGLLHDVGKLIILGQDARRYERCIDNLNASGISIIEAEEQEYELNHVEVGGWAADEWRFPQPVKEAILYHHLAWQDAAEVTTRKDISISSLIKIADTICHSLAIGHRRQNSFMQLSMRKSLPQAWEMLTLNLDSQQELLDELSRDVQTQLEKYDPEQL